MSPDEAALYRIVFFCKEALEIILEEAQTDQDWSVVSEAAESALDRFE